MVNNLRTVLLANFYRVEVGIVLLSTFASSPLSQGLKDCCFLSMPPGTTEAGSLTREWSHNNVTQLTAARGSTDRRIVRGVNLMPVGFGRYISSSVEYRNQR